MDTETAEAALRHWRDTVNSRDQLVRDALAAGLTINRIHTLTGITRKTIYKIRDESPGH